MRATAAAEEDNGWVKASGAVGARGKVYRRRYQNHKTRTPGQRAMLLLYRGEAPSPCRGALRYSSRVQQGSYSTGAVTCSAWGLQSRCHVHRHQATRNMRKSYCQHKSRWDGKTLELVLTPRAVPSCHLLSTLGAKQRGFEGEPPLEIAVTLSRADSWYRAQRGFSYVWAGGMDVDRTDHG